MAGIGGERSVRFWVLSHSKPTFVQADVVRQRPNHVIGTSTVDVRSRGNGPLADKDLSVGSRLMPLAF